MTGATMIEARADDLSEDRETLIRDGVVGLRSAFARDWAERMREDMSCTT